MGSNIKKYSGDNGKLWIEHNILYLMDVGQISNIKGISIVFKLQKETIKHFVKKVKIYCI